MCFFAFSFSFKIALRLYIFTCFSFPIPYGSFQTYSLSVSYLAVVPRPQDADIWLKASGFLPHSTAGSRVLALGVFALRFLPLFPCYNMRMDVVGGWSCLSDSPWLVSSDTSEVNTTGLKTRDDKIEPNSCKGW